MKCKYESPLQENLTESIQPNYKNREFYLKDAQVKTSVIKHREQKYLPEFIKPMLCKTKDTAFDHPDWIFENKYDGYRAIAHIQNSNCKLYSRNKLSFDSTYPEIKKSLSLVGEDMILDGEIAIEDESGITKFQLLQNFRSTGLSPCYFVFDILYLNGFKLTELPLIYRKEILKTIFEKQELNNIVLSPFIRSRGTNFFIEKKKNNAEGIIAKNGLSYYEAGNRSNNWLKIKNLNEQEAVIVGFTQPKGERLFFGSIILALKVNNRWKYIGHCGTGFSQKMLENLYKKFNRIIAQSSPFNIPLKLDGKIQWLKPRMVCQIKFNEWTKDGLMRQPVFIGLRKDKHPREIQPDIHVGKIK